MNTLIIFGAKYLIIVPILAVLVWFIHLPKHERKTAFLTGLITLPLAYLIAKISGHFYFDPRPFVIGNFTPLISHAADNGFPSDHALFAGALAASVMYFNKRLSIALWIIALLIGIARVYAGVHHPIDIIGGLIIAAIAGIVAHIVLQRK